MRAALRLEVLVMLPIAAEAGELQFESRNTLLFVESSQPRHEWEAYRLAEDRQPVIMRARGPGRVMLSLRTFASKGVETAVAVVLLDDSIVLTAKVEPERDPLGAFADDPHELPSKVSLFLVRVPPGDHRVTVRYSGGASMLVAARFSEGGEVLDAEGEVMLAAPKVEEKVVPSVGALHAAGELEAEPTRDREVDRALPEGDAWGVTPDPPPAEPAPHAGPKADPGATRLQSIAGPGRELTVRAPWLAIEVHAGIELDRLAFSVAPILGAEARVPLPWLDARMFTAGLAIHGAYGRTEAALADDVANQTIGIAEVRHLRFGATADLRWSFLAAEELDPFVALGAGGLLGEMTTKVGEREDGALTKALYAAFSFGAALGGRGHRPFLAARLAAGLLGSELVRSGRGDAATHSVAYGAFDLVIGYRFELLTDVAVR
jgi:hypothetical protein